VATAVIVCDVGTEMLPPAIGLEALGSVPLRVYRIVSPGFPLVSETNCAPWYVPGAGEPKTAPGAIVSFSSARVLPLAPSKTARIRRVPSFRL
jgi:hypothetical protein